MAQLNDALGPRQVPQRVGAKLAHPHPVRESFGDHLVGHPDSTV